ncbi:hypothetical protein ACFYOK_37340 [Microbispora bryophytorum]|uniref:hypothetical protein n=1 Tax=Microbispora bryophytorum TaxID=1460882 RepID=UPI0033E95E04
MDGWTIEDAVVNLHPPMSADEIRMMVAVLGIPRAGLRRHGRGRPAATYDSTTLQHAHALVIRGRVDLALISAA